MTKIAVVTECNPFEQTPRLLLANDLAARLKDNGHEAYVLKVPVDWHNGDALMQSILAIRLLRLGNVDRVVALDFPAAIVQHPDKYAWITQKPEFVARDNFAHMLSVAGTLAQLEAEAAPHRLAVMQELLKRMFLSYADECQKTIYCQNAQLEDNDLTVAPDVEQLALTATLKSSLSNLVDNELPARESKMPSLILSPYKSDEQFRKELPWSEIVIYLT